MKGKGKRIIAALLACIMVCSSFSIVSFAKSSTWTHGWLREDGTWYYYEKDYKDKVEPKRRNDFAISPTGVEEVFTMYYLNDQCTIIEEEGGFVISGPDGKKYMLTAGGAVKGGQLGSYYDGGEEKHIWFTEPATGKLAVDKWYRIEEDDAPYWFYFQQDKDSKKGIGYAYRDTTEKIGQMWYHFDEKGHMTEGSFVPILSDDGVEYKAYAQIRGDLAENKWLWIDEQWYYFKNRPIPGWKSPIPVALTGTAEIDGKSYEFDSEGCLISGQTPYRPVHSSEISSAKDQVYVGEKLIVNVEIQVASSSNAVIATMSNAEKKALADGDAYDAYIQYEAPGISSYDKLKLESGQLRWTFIPSVEGDVSIALYIDGEVSNTLDISCEINPNKQEIPSYMKEVFSGIMNSELPGEEVVNRLSEKYQELDPDTVSKLRDDDGILRELEKFEKIYSSGQGMGCYSKELQDIKKLVDTDKISVVGGYLNTDTDSVEKVSFSMKTDTEVDLQGIKENIKMPFDISLNGGNIDSSSLKIPVTVTMPIPKGMSQKGLKLYHIHDGVTSELPLSQTQLAKGNARFTMDGMSTFVFANDTKDNTESSSDSGSDSESSFNGSGHINTANQKSDIPETPGEWKQTAEGWQFLNTDGSPYSNIWIYVKGKWYWLDPNGMMALGWRELNGKRYYFMPATGEMAIGWINDGLNWYYTGANGVMQTGWVETIGKWYYLDFDGHMLSATITPDNYRVDESGAWINN